MKALGAFGSAAFVLALVGSSVAAREVCTDKDKLEYGSVFFEKYREVTYWGRAGFDISDYHSNSGDADFLHLVVKDKSRGIGHTLPVSELQQHFLKEFRKFFGDLPFHDTDIGKDARFDQFVEQNKHRLSSFDPREFDASELARRRSLYGGRAGAINCAVAVKGRRFPVLFETRCGISAEDYLMTYAFQDAKDIGSSSLHNIRMEIKVALSAMLKKKGTEFSKIRNCRPK